MIPEKLLEDFDAQTIHLPENDLVFTEGKSASFFYQIKQGSIKVTILTKAEKNLFKATFTKEKVLESHPCLEISLIPQLLLP